MRWRHAAHPLSRPFPVVGAAVAGVAVGHWLAYLLTVPQGSARAALLAATGHGYWSTAVAAALVFGSLTLIGTVARHFLRGLGRGGWVVGRSGAGPAASWHRERLEWVAARLVLLQGAIYLVQEVVERLVKGAPVAGMLHDGVLPVGLLTQTLVALHVAVLLVLVGRAAEAAGRALARIRARPRHARPAVAAWPVLAVRPMPLRGAALGSRAPPSLVG
jgi:hypothetical protein